MLQLCPAPCWEAVHLEEHVLFLNGVHHFRLNMWAEQEERDMRKKRKKNTEWQLTSVQFWG